MSNLKKLGPFRSGLDQHGNIDDWFLLFNRVVQVFCGNTYGFR